MDFKSSYVNVGWNPSTLYLTWIITGRRRLLIRQHHTLRGSSQVDVLQDLLSCALHDQQSYILSIKSEGYCHIFFSMTLYVYYSSLFQLIHFLKYSLISWNWLSLPWWWNYQYTLPLKAFIFNWNSFMIMRTYLKGIFTNWLRFSNNL